MKIRKIRTLMLGLIVGVGILSSCQGKEDPNSIKITVVHLGYGTEWLRALSKAYSKKTGQTFNIVEKVGQDGLGAINAEFESGASDTDIFVTRPQNLFKTYYEGSIVHGGKTYENALADLTDVWESKNAGESKAIKEKMNPLFESYHNIDGHYYALPWAGGIFGIVRNIDVWDKLALKDEDVPLTTKEMFALGAKVKNKGIAPFIYCKSDEYYSTLIPIWFAQYQGSEVMANFYDGLDINGESTSALYDYNGQERCLDVLSELLKKQGGKYLYQHEQSETLSFTSAQGYFMKGQALFMANGAWLENEAGANYKNAKIDYIKTPVISSIVSRLSFGDVLAEDKADALLSKIVGFVDNKPDVGDNEGIPNGTTEEDVEIVRDARNKASYLADGFDHNFVVPSYSAKLGKAKDFLKYVYSDEGLNIYYSSMNGSRLPASPCAGYDSEVEATTFRRFINKAVEEGKLSDYAAQNKAKVFCLGGVNRYFVNGLSGSIVTNILNGSSAHDIVETNRNYLRDHWNEITSKF